MPNTDVRVEDFGASESNTGAQNATAFAAAIAALPPSGGTVRFSGHYVVDQIEFPNDPKVVNLVGTGVHACELIMGTAAGPLIHKVAGTGRITGAHFAHFTVRANAGSDKTNLNHIALDLSGWGASRFENIGYTGATTGTGPTGSVGIFINLNASVVPTYNNVFSNLVITDCFGPSRVVYTTNGGSGVGGNPNNIELRDSWFYGCSGINVVFDGYCSTRSAVINNLFEDCTGAQAVTLGQSCHVVGNWFELIGYSVVSSASASVDGSSAVVTANYFSGQGAIYLEAMGVPPLWIGNAGGGQTFTGPTKPAVIQGPGSLPNAPTLTVSNGSATLISSVAGAMDFTGRVTFHLRYLCTPSSIGSAIAALALPASFKIEQAQLGATRTANGKPTLTALQGSGSGDTFAIYVEAVDNHEIDVRVTLIRS